MPGLDLAIVVSDRNRGWVLETIAKELERHYRGTTAIAYGVRRLPRAKAYFYTHYSLFGPCVRRNPALLLRRNLVFFTHPSHSSAEAKAVARRLRRASAVMSMCTLHASSLVADGVLPGKVHVVIPGTDSTRFVSHERGGGVVGFCSAFYERKDPERLLALVHAMPHRRFVLIGRGWRAWSGFPSLASAPNFAYLEPDYQDYPQIYHSMDVFVSASRLEGGPIPLLEAMMSNVVPVSSRTGFAPDLIEHGSNGYLFDVGAPVDEMCDLVDRAFELDTDVRSTVADRTWPAFATRVQEVAEGATPSTAGSSRRSRIT